MEFNKEELKQIKWDFHLFKNNNESYQSCNNKGKYGSGIILSEKMINLKIPIA